MKKFTLKFTSAFASASLVATLLAPIALADTNVTVSGNGAGSENEVVVVNGGGTGTSITQNSSTQVGALVLSSASTGGNSANQNTTKDGDITIDTGNATSTSGLTVVGGSNNATVDGCGCPQGNTTVDIKNNGANTENEVVVINGGKKKAPKEKVEQTTSVGVLAAVGSKAATGKNKANKNTTKGGNVEVITGTGLSSAGLTVVSGGNTATVNP